MSNRKFQFERWCEATIISRQAQTSWAEGMQHVDQREAVMVQLLPKASGCCFVLPAHQTEKFGHP